MLALETLKVILVAGYVEWGSWVASESMGYGCSTILGSNDFG